MSTDESRKAARVVAGRAHDAADRDLLLDMLGLLAEATPEAPVVEAPVVAEPKDGHGRMRAYMAGCHCDHCRAKNAEMRQEGRQRAKSDPDRADRAGHGKANTYKNHGCRCDDCRSAYSAWMREYKARKRVAA